MKRALKSLFRFLAGAACLLSLIFFVCGQEMHPWDSKAGVVFQRAGSANIRELITAATLAKPRRTMTGSGLVGVMGSIQVTTLAPGEHDLLFPLPQLADFQAPVAYSIICTPSNALSECRIQERAEGNAFVNLKLKAATGEPVKVEWSAVLLIGAQRFATNQIRPDEYLAATPCAQSEDKQIVELANKLWPASGNAEQYARAIQQFIRNLKQKSQPRTLDAAGCLASGANWICTANANLASALMRARHLPCRSIAVVPPNSQRLEMHRVVEYFDHGTWVSFDPSLLQPDVPLKPWHEIIMTKTTIADEQTSMKPRMGSALGCPLGQEVELSNGLTLSGNDFFWTIAAPLAQFEVSDEAARLTADTWERFLKTGVLSANSVKAVVARNLDQFLAGMRH